MTAEQASRPRVVVVGGGIAGLAAAFFLRDVAAVTVFEGVARLGGKLAVSGVAGVAVDEGAEALLARRPEGTGLAAAVGLAGAARAAGHDGRRGDLDPGPATAAAAAASSWACPPTWTSWPGRGSCRRRDWPRPAPAPRLPADQQAGDQAVSRYLGARLGPGGRGPAGRPAARRGVRGPVRPAVVRGDHAGPGRRHPGRPAGHGGRRPAAGQGPRGPPGAARPRRSSRRLPGGLASLVPAVSAASAADVRTGAMVRAIERSARGWRLTAGPRTTRGLRRPTRSCWRCPRPRPAGCWPGCPAPPRPPPGWPR